MRKNLFSPKWGWAGFFTHIHHGQDCPIEQSDNIKERFYFINSEKDWNERRLRKALIRRVPDHLLPAVALKFLRKLMEYEKAVDQWENAITALRGVSFFKRGDSQEKRDVEIARNEAEDLERECDLLEDKIAEISNRRWIKIHAQVCHPNCRWTPEDPNIFADGYSTSVLRRRKKR